MNSRNDSKPRKGIRFRFGLRGLLLGVVALGIVFGTVRPRILSYLTRYGYLEIYNGASLETVQELLGPGELIDDSGFREWARGAARQQEPEIFPDGIEDTDVFLKYTIASRHPQTKAWIGAGTAYFQFRDGRLVNEGPEVRAVLRGCRLDPP